MLPDCFKGLCTAPFPEAAPGPSGPEGSRWLPTRRVPSPNPISAAGQITVDVGANGALRHPTSADNPPSPAAAAQTAPPVCTGDLMRMSRVRKLMLIVLDL